ncbi:MAG TPA: hypothetical protein VJ010_02390, partial [Actinomycetota bacterium]|nr:hypothetical protein [Actinomycetota bacterium]
IETLMDTLPGDSFWPATCVAAGGTVKALARLMIASGAAAGPLHGLQLATVDVEALGELLLVEGQRRRRRMPGMDGHRVDVLGAGTLVLARLLRRLGLGGIAVSEWGLREGVILEAVEPAQGVPPRRPSRRRVKASRNPSRRRIKARRRSGGRLCGSPRWRSSDDPAFPASADDLYDALTARWWSPEQVEKVRIPGLGHALAEEPGIDPARQTPGAAQVDEIVSAWLTRRLTG